MCPKMADGEIASMKSLMISVLNAGVTRVFGLEPTEIAPDLGLYADLRMSASQRSQLTDFVDEYFDGVRLEIGARTTLRDVYEQVVE